MTLGAAVEGLSDGEAKRLIARLVNRSQTSQETLIRATSQQAYATWMTEGGRLTVEEWAARYVRITAPAQREMFQTVIAATAEHYAIAARTVIPTPAIRYSMVVDEADYAARSAQLMLRQQLLEDVAFETAMDRAGRHMIGLLATDLQKAQRDAGRAWAESPEGREYREIHRGWRKVPSGTSCGWCQVVADQIYHDPGTIPAHDHDHCGFSTVVAGDGWEPHQLTGGEWEDVISRRADPDAATLPTAQSTSGG